MKIALVCILSVLAWFGSIGQPANQLRTDFKAPFSIDSLQWKFYTLSYAAPLKKYVDRGGLQYELEEDSLFWPVECELRIDRTKSRGDSIEYFLRFSRGDSTDRYLEGKKDSYVGVGFVNQQDTYYPLAGGGGIILEPLPDFWKKQEKLFSAYLKSYKGKLTGWLREQAQRRGIL